MNSFSKQLTLLKTPIWLAAVWCIGLVSCSASFKQDSDPEVVWSRPGYLPDSEKRAVVRNVNTEYFRILSADSDSVVYESSIESSPEYDNLSGDRIITLDFSVLTETGQYKIHLPELNVYSEPFRIDYNIFDDELKSLLRSFYLQRCGTNIEDVTWARPACHLDDAPFFDDRGDTAETTGGWHDAGDHNKFVVTTTVSAGLLMQLFELDPDHFRAIELNIPESGNNRPDILDEVKWALDWLMSMQREDGAVHFKVSKKQWTGEYKPHTEPDTRYIFEVSSTATAGTAAVLAQAARLFRDYDQTYASRLLQHSRLAWQWLEQHPDIVPEGGFTNPEGVRGGEYPDEQDLDERLWAAAELYKTTGGSDYLNFFKNHYTRIADGGFGYPVLSWQSTGSLAFATILNSGDQLPEEVRQRIYQRSKRYGDQVLNRVDANPYRYVLSENSFYWGSNSVAMGYAFDLIQVWRITGEPQYLDAAEQQLYYLLGRNPFGIAYVTSNREGWVNHPYHQWVIEADNDKTLEGMLVGGPNRNSEMRRSPSHQYPARWYRDDHREYTVNEVAINYTASLGYVLGFFTLTEDQRQRTKFE